MKKLLLLVFIAISSLVLAQPANDVCSGAHNFGTLGAPGACGSGIQNGVVSTIASTNVNATPDNPYYYQAGCSSSLANNVWYTFTAPANGFGIRIVVSGAGGTLSNPQISLWQGTCAGGFAPMGCISGAGGTATLALGGVLVAGTTYYFSISGADVTQNGPFTLSVNSYQDCSDCLNAGHITVNPLPVNGGYLPGQTVNFCFHVDQWSQINFNYLHGIQMSFGSGWDLTTLTTTAPATYLANAANNTGCAGSCGTWAYYPAGCTNSSSGVHFGPGFYHNGSYLYNSGTGVCSCYTAADPGAVPSSAGGGDGSSNLADGGNVIPPAGAWNFCWSIQVLNSGCNPGAPLTVTVTATGDGQSGDYTAVGCGGNQPVNFNAVQACCPPSIAATTTIACNGASTGVLTATATTGVSGNQDPYVFNWTGPSGTVATNTVNVGTTNSVSGVPVGTYTVVVTDKNSCSSSSVLTITQPTALTVTLTPTSAGCTTGGSITTAPGGGSPGYSYAWAGPGAYTSTTQSPSGLNAGTYTLTLTDSKNCTKTATVVVGQTGSVSAGISSSSTSQCFATNSFTFTNTGTAAVTYSWNYGDATALGSGSPATHSYAAAGTYTVTETVTSGVCTATTAVTVTVTATPTMSVAQTTFTTCLNSPVTFTASGATSYNWTPTTGMTGSGTANPTVTPTTTTTIVYSVTGTTGGCATAAHTVTLTVNPLPTISVVPSSTAICSGGGSSTLTASGASTYTWANPATLSSPNGSVVTATPTNTATPTVYTVTGTDGNNCVNKNTVSITVNPTPTVSIVGGGGNSQTVCGGGLANANVAGITFTSTPSGTINWTNNNTNLGGAQLSNPSGTGSITGYAAPSVTVQTVGVITASVTTAAGCASTNSTQLNYTITINPIPGETGDVITPAGCGLSNGTIIGATGTGGSTYSYEWNNAGGFVAGSSYTNAAGTYPLQIKDNVTGCIYSQNFTIPNAGAPAPPTITPSATAACVGGMVVLTANPPAPVGTTYNWSESNTNTGTGDTYTITSLPASPNPYIVGVTATASNCTGTSYTLGIVVNPLPTPVISSSTSQICQGSSTTLSVTPTGNYSYQWGNSGGTIASATSSTLAVTIADTYSVTVTDNSTNCSASTSANGAITVNPLPTIDTTGVLITQTSCTVATGGITNVTITGAPSITYTWTSGSAGGAAVSNGSGTSATLSNAGAGVYCLNVTDGNTCQNSFCSITITNAGAPPPPTLAASGNDTTYCPGDPMQTLTVTTTGTVTPTVNWYSDAGLTTTIATNTNTYTPSAGLPVGTTTLYVTATVNGCTSSGTPITITINPTPTITINPLGSNSVICNGASVLITPSGATSYTLNPGNQIGTSFTVSPTSSTTYTIDGTDGTTTCSNASANSALVPITVNPTPTISINPLGSNSVICNGASVVITPSGATSYTLNPGNQTGTSFTVSPTSSMTYTIDGTDGTTTCQNATADAASVPITVNPTPTISINPLGSNSVICVGSSVVITPSGATSYTLNPGNQIGTSFTVSPTSSTTYTISGTDGTSTCQNATADAGLAPITVNPTPTISINPLGSGGTICSGASVLIVPTGATTYTLNPGNITGTSFNVNPTSSTTYTISGSDGTTTCSNATADAAIVPITVNPTPTVNVSNSTIGTADCGQATGGVTGINNNSVSGGTLPYNYQWTNTSNGIVVSTDSVLKNQGIGTYSLQVTDANGCIASVTGGISTFTVLGSPTIVAQAITNPNPATGTIPLAVTFSNTSVGATSFAWSFGDGNSSLAVNPTNTYTNIGTYTVTLTAINGPCTNTTTILVIANIPTTIIIPNIFTPNGDGTNDEFFIPNTGISSLNCDIFNRWGQLLHTITAPNQGWDGITPNGDKAPEGTYMYILQALGLDGKTYKQQGTVTLIR